MTSWTLVDAFHLFYAGHPRWDVGVQWECWAWHVLDWKITIFPLSFCMMECIKRYAKEFCYEDKQVCIQHCWLLKMLMSKYLSLERTLLWRTPHKVGVRWVVKQVEVDFEPIEEFQTSLLLFNGESSILRSWIPCPIFSFLGKRRLKRGLDG